MSTSVFSKATAGGASARGAFIVFEGIDRCGKSTQAALLSKSLPSSIGIRYPDRTSTIGTLINSYLASASNMSDETIHLLFSANRWEANENVKKQLMSGTNLVCDRYAHSGVAFSAAKGMNLDWCKGPDRGLIAPDAIIYMDMPVSDASQRGQFGEERYEKIDFQEKVRSQFMALRKEDEGNNCVTSRIPWYTMDAGRSIEDLQRDIEQLVATITEDVKNKDLKYLWSSEIAPDADK